MDAGTVSGPLLVSVSSDNPSQDVMTAWQFQLEIVAESGASGSLTFQDPTSGVAPNPSNYVFGTNGLDINSTNDGSSLAMNGFFDPNTGTGTSVPGSPGANLAELTFSASPDASGFFGLYAVRDPASTQWNDDSFATRYFTNVPQGTGVVRIGEILVNAAVPEPSSLALLGTSVLLLVAWNRKRQNS